jgi:hypothetical protein
MKQTKIVHLKKEPYDVYIGRPSKWGNPYSHKEGTLAEFRVKNRAEALEKYEKYLLENETLFNSLIELQGKTLGCWCKPNKCHGDILVKWSNSIGIQLF